MESAQKIPQISGPSDIVSDSAPDHVVADYGAALGITLAYMGDKLGLFKAMAFKGAISAEELALACFLSEPVVRDWLINIAAEGYIEYDFESDSFALPDENAMALTDKNSLLYISGGFEVVEKMKQADAYIRTSFLNGNGDETRAFHRTFLRDAEPYSKAKYIEQKLYNWLAAIPEVLPKLEAGIRVADIGCSHGSSTIVLAKHFPNSMFNGFEPHYYSVDRGNMMAKQRRLGNVHFWSSGAEHFEGNEYDLITFFNCLHEVANPLATFKHCFEALKPDGVIMVSEHLAGYVTEASYNPLKRMFKGASVLHCLLNNVATDDVDKRDELEKVARKAGFTSYKRAVDTEFERILEIRR